MNEGKPDLFDQGGPAAKRHLCGILERSLTLWQEECGVVLEANEPVTVEIIVRRRKGSGALQWFCKADDKGIISWGEPIEPGMNPLGVL